MTTVGFVIPIRHQDNIKDREKHKSVLYQTINSLMNQTKPDWKCAVTANEFPPDFPEDPQFIRAQVNFPPNPIHDISRQTYENQQRSWKAVRHDKGRRVAAALKAMGWREAARFMMVVDDDDLVHCDLVRWLSDAPADATGYVVTKGYEWADGSGWISILNEFDKRCGTCLIPALSSLDLPAQAEDLNEKLVDRWFGSHRYMRSDLEERGRALQPVPFRAAIYRVANVNSYSGKGLNTDLTRLQKLKRVVKDTRRLRFLTKQLSRNFFGAPTAGL